MSWFKYKYREAALPWKEWVAARKDPEDLKALVALGSRTAREASGEVPSAALNRQVEALANMMNHAFKGKDASLMRAVASSVEGREAPIEPRLWDPPSLSLEAHRRLSRKNTIEPIPAQALLLGDELDTRVRPGLLRSAWLLALATGTDTPYAEAMLGPGMQPRSFSYALQGLRSGLAAPGPRGLKPGERRAMLALADGAASFKVGHFAVDDVISCMRSGSFRYSEGWLELTKGAEWVLLSPGTLRRGLARALRIACVMEAQKVMLLVWAAHAVDGLRPRGISMQSHGCDVKGTRSKRTGEH